MGEGASKKNRRYNNRNDLQTRYYSVKTAAKLLDCSEQFFRNLIRDRKIGFVKFGRMVRIPVSEIEKLKIEYQSISAIYDKAIAK